MDTPEDLLRVARAPDDAALWKKIESLSTEERRELVHGLKAEVDRLVREEPPRAVPAARALLRAADGLEDLYPLALRGRAVAAHYTGDGDTALACFEEARRLYLAGGRAVEAARVARSLIDVHLAGGRTAEALACGREALEVFEARGETRLAAQVRLNLGNVYTRMDDYPVARTSYEAARTRFEELGDGLGTAYADFNLVVVGLRDNRLEEARRACARARTRFESEGMGLLVADCDYNAAYLAARCGEYGEAVRGLERAARLYERNGKPSGPPLCNLDLAEIHLWLDAHRDALRLAELAVEGFRSLGLDYEQARGEAIAGMAAASLGDLERARASMDAACARLRRLGNVGSAAAVELSRAAIDLDHGRAAEAYERLAACQAELERCGLVVPAEIAGVQLAAAELELARPEDAARRLEELIRAGRAGGSFDRLVAADAWTLLGRARLRLGDRAAAMVAFEEAVARTEESSSAIARSDLCMAFFRRRHAVYVELVQLLVEEGEARRALAVLEQGRARTLFHEAPGDAAAAELRRARERLDWLLTRTLDAQLEPAWSDRPIDVTMPTDAELRAAEAEVTRLSPARRAPSRADALDLDALVEGARGNDDVLLVYLPRETETLVFVADERGLTTRTCPLGVEAVARLRDRLWLHVDSLRLGRGRFERRRAGLTRAIHGVLAELGRGLLEPVAEALDAPAVTVVPYGVLHDLPLHAMIVDGVPFLADHEVAVGLSLTHLARVRAPRRRAPSRLYVASTDDPDLPAAREEARAIRRTYGDSAAELPATALTAAGLGALPPAASVHVASHGIFRSTRPAFSGLRLDDGFLFARDLDGVRLDLELVSLSGCVTGRKAPIDGEEVLGLTRSLVSAGVRAVLGSAWAVDDGAAGELAARFYHHLALGATARSALTRAQRELFAEDEHPVSWAAFTLVGDPMIRLPAPHGVSP